MKSLTLALVLMLAATAVFAHDGALSLYRDQSISDCDMASALFATDTIRLFYVRGSGPEMGNAAQFKGTKSSAMVLFNPKPAWAPSINLTIGDFEMGIAITAASCLGTSQDVVFLGEVYVFNMGEAGTFTVKIEADPNANPPGIYITECNPDQTVYPVLGGTFVFNGSCNPGVEESSWGAIKSLYR